MMPLEETLQRLAAVAPTTQPFVSAYVDLSPDLRAGTRPFGGGDEDAPRRSWRRTAEPELGHVRPGIVQARALLGERKGLLAGPGPESESFAADADRILRYLEDGEFDPSAQGIALFACAAENVWEVIELPVPVETTVAVDRTPLVYPLAYLDDAYDRFVLCLADSQTARVYVVALGRAEREETIDGPAINYKMTGGWSQRRIQQRIENAVSDHIREVARRLEEIAFSEEIPHIVLAGDEIVYTEFKNHLSPQAWQRVLSIERLDTKSPEHEAVARALEIVQAAERDEARDIARQALDETLAGALGAAGVEAVAHALRLGAVDTLVVDKGFHERGWRCEEDPSQIGGNGAPESCPVVPGAAEPADLREEMTALALQSGARVEFVENSEELARMGGVGALLRWRPPTLPPSVVAEEESEKNPSPEAAERTITQEGGV